MRRFLFVTLLFASVLADLPVHCLSEQVLGVWKFQLSPVHSGVDYLDCPNFKYGETTDMMVSLQAPSTARDLSRPADVGVGFWTMIYDEGFEVRLEGRSFFGYNLYHKWDNGTVTSYCDTIPSGWYHEIGNSPTQWGCFRAFFDHALTAENDAVERVVTGPAPQDPYEQAAGGNQAEAEEPMWGDDRPWVAQINAAQSSWEATSLTPDGAPIALSQALHGSRRFTSALKMQQRPRPARNGNPEYGDLPAQFDWRNVSGVDYVGPMRDQLSCGSCYAFASAGVMEASLRIQSQLATRVILSPQDVVSCGPYMQGCSGGFGEPGWRVGGPLRLMPRRIRSCCLCPPSAPPADLTHPASAPPPEYLVGRLASERGLAELRCMTYAPADQSLVPCGWKCNDTQQYWYAQDYEWVGGYYGASDEVTMMRTIYEKGPISVGIYTYPDFMSYKSGIYHHVASATPAHVGRWEATTHAVVVVGWGANQTTGEKYWIVKNSWSAMWGERGYVRSVWRGLIPPWSRLSPVARSDPAPVGPDPSSFPSSFAFVCGGRVRRGTDEIAIESMASHITARLEGHPAPRPLPPPPRPTPTPTPIQTRTPAAGPSVVPTVLAVAFGALSGGLLIGLATMAVILCRFRSVALRQDPILG
ncbi:putative Dipeptidyl peptidase 1 [Paratrimastix pyriformis]|uniref:Dipeptidyl peptidase 1 n=1 Tax=Paratrimastix pyriformis TaxID=342808 RepID=A0ABQ8UM83_9EUKA|nr:putative Dipeptidyl peptidase 1 [Paratrimastix pyriformis]